MVAVTNVPPPPSPHTNLYVNFRKNLGRYILPGLRRITVKLGKFANFKVLFPVVRDKS